MRLLALALLGLSLPVVGMAQIYQWTDATGQSHFSQTPPEQGTYKRLNPVTSSGFDNGNLSGYVKQGDKQDAEAAKAHDAEMQAKAGRAERCAKARERITSLETATARRLMVTGADGQPSRMTDEQFNKELGEAHKAETESCG